MKIALDPYMFRRVPLTDLPGLVADLGYSWIELSPRAHYAIADYGTAHRRGERVTVAGPVPVGVDGRPSVAVRGDASAYYAGGVDH